jgi:dinuclear metal center YbgI/SA1388 family protein
MPTVTDIYQFLDTKAPFALQESWDNSGFLVGRGEQQVSTVFVSLDITLDTIREAAACGAQLMVSHHPVIFHPAKRLTDQPLDGDGQILLSLVGENLSAICCHTNLDSVSGGVNDRLAEVCGLTNVRQLCQSGIDCYGRPYGIGRVGELEAAMPLENFLPQIKARLGSHGLRYASAEKPVYRVAVGGGACGSMVEDALRAGCDTFVTSDLRYNDFLSAKLLGINLIDAGHFPTEQPVVEVLAGWLQTAYPHLRVVTSGVREEVISYA